jgi:hypothetical protein
MKHTNENDERLEPPGQDREAIRAIVERKLRDQELGIEPDYEAEAVAFREWVKSVEGTGPPMTEDEIEAWVAEAVPRNWLAHPLVVRIDDPGDHEERRP